MSLRRHLHDLLWQGLLPFLTFADLCSLQATQRSSLQLFTHKKLCALLLCKASRTVSLHVWTVSRVRRLVRCLADVETELLSGRSIGRLHAELVTRSLQQLVLSSSSSSCSPPAGVGVTGVWQRLSAFKRRSRNDEAPAAALQLLCKPASPLLRLSWLGLPDTVLFTAGCSCDRWLLWWREYNGPADGHDVPWLWFKTAPPSVRRRWRQGAVLEVRQAVHELSGRTCWIGASTETTSDEAAEQTWSCLRLFGYYLGRVLRLRSRDGPFASSSSSIAECRQRLHSAAADWSALPIVVLELWHLENLHTVRLVYYSSLSSYLHSLSPAAAHSLPDAAQQSVPPRALEQGLPFMLSLFAQGYHKTMQQVRSEDGNVVRSAREYLSSCVTALTRLRQLQRELDWALRYQAEMSRSRALQPGQHAQVDELIQQLEDARQDCRRLEVEEL